MILLVLSVILVWSAEKVPAGDKNSKVVIAAIMYGNTCLQALQGFKDGLKEKGYIEGDTVEYVFYGPNRVMEDLPGVMDRLMARNPDLIFTATTPATLAAKKATAKKKVPVVFGPVNDPVRAGIVKEQKRPGDNMTGVMLTDSIEKQLEWAIKISPGIKTLLLPYNPKDKSSLITLQTVKKGVEVFKIDLITREVHSEEEIDALLANFPAGIDAVFLPRDGMIMSRVEDFAELARKQKIVLTGTRLAMAERGALFGFGFSDYEMGRQMSRLAYLILNGRSPGDLPVETAEDYLASILKPPETLDFPLTSIFCGRRTR